MCIRDSLHPPCSTLVPPLLNPTPLVSPSSLVARTSNCMSQMHSKEDGNMGLTRRLVRSMPNLRPTSYSESCGRIRYRSPSRMCTPSCTKGYARSPGELNTSSVLQAHTHGDGDRDRDAQKDIHANIHTHLRQNNEVTHAARPVVVGGSVSVELGASVGVAWGGIEGYGEARVVLVSSGFTLHLHTPRHLSRSAHASELTLQLAPSLAEGRREGA
eukprot:804842-Rhodomonas_salina.1